MCSKVPHSHPQALHGAEARLDLASAEERQQRWTWDAGEASSRVEAASARVLRDRWLCEATA